MKNLLKHLEEYGNEYWYACELQKALEYKDWRNFEKVIDKAIVSSKNSISNREDWVVEVNDPIKTGKGKEEIIKIITIFPTWEKWSRKESIGGKKMIINTGMRTDIPAFYSKWFLNRIKEGYVYVRNPYYKHQVTKYILDPSVVDCLAFCTKNPHPLISHLEELDKYKQFWFVTITPYGKGIEPNVPDKKEVINDFKKLSRYLGKKAVAIRYDPIFINKEFDVNKHIQCFEKLLSELKDYTEDCTISFLDMYDCIKRNALDLRTPTYEEQILIAKNFSEIGKKYNITIHACCEKEFLKDYGLDITGCMSKEIVEKAIGSKLNSPKNNSKRDMCNCLMGNDIGSYNTCMHLCRYCYANSNPSLVKENVKKHNPDSPFLIGDIEKEDKIVLSKQKSWLDKDIQISLFN